MSLWIDIRFSRPPFALHFTARLSGGVTGLFGPSGAGKTTLLHCIAGLTRPDSGRIMLDETVLYDATSNHHLPPWKRQMGLVFQDHLLFPHLSVEKNLAYGQQGSPTEQRSQRLEIAALLEVEAYLKRKVTELSGGQKQRVALARAILTHPKLLLLDEPFAGLDQALKQRLIAYLKALYAKTRIPMILVSHDPDDMLELADEMLFLETGQLAAQGVLTPSTRTAVPGRLCGTGQARDFHTMRHHLIRRHSLQFPTR